MIVEKDSYPFEKGKPSLFVIGESPFQALCAIEAIRDLEIGDYKLVMCKQHALREGQTLALLNQYKIEYECVEQDKVLSLKGRIEILRSQYNKYKRVFVGDFRGLQFYYCAFRYASNNSTIISLDDGSCNVSLLRGVYKVMLKNKIKIINYWYINFVSTVRSLIKDKYLYTMFYDIENKHYFCYPNTMQHIQLSTIGKKYDGIYFVGTNTSKFAEVLSVKIGRQYKILDTLFDKLRSLYPTERIVYIPHGADNDDYIKRMCQTYDFKYERPDTLVELYMLNLKKSPKIVYGFTSTALFTIKRIFPHTKVINLLFHGDYPYYERRKSVSEYYSLHGVETEDLYL